MFFKQINDLLCTTACYSSTLMHVTIRENGALENQFFFSLIFSFCLYKKRNIIIKSPINQTPLLFH